MRSSEHLHLLFSLAGVPFLVFIQCSGLHRKSTVGRPWPRSKLRGPGIAQPGSEPSPSGQEACIRAQGPGPRENWAAMPSLCCTRHSGLEEGSPGHALLCCYPPGTEGPGASSPCLQDPPAPFSQSPSTSTWDLLFAPWLLVDALPFRPQVQVPHSGFFHHP